MIRLQMMKIRIRKEVNDMAKKNRTSRLKKVCRSFTNRLKRSLDGADAKIMTYVMLLITLVAILSITIAWMTFGKSITIGSGEFGVGDYQKIKVTKENDINADDISKQDNQTVEEYFDVSIPEFVNVRENDKLQPGIYGCMTFYVTALDEDITSCRISPEIITDCIDTISDEDKAQIDELLNGHMLLFSQRTGSAGDYSYLGWINADNPYEVALTYKTPVRVDIYWVWPYEYADLEKIITDNAAEEHQIALGDRQIFEWNRPETIYSESDRYDYADSFIGSNVNNIVFHMAIKEVAS